MSEYLPGIHLLGGMEPIVFWIGVFGRFDLAALGGCHTLNVCYVMLCYVLAAPSCWGQCNERRFFVVDRRRLLRSTTKKRPGGEYTSQSVTFVQQPHTTYVVTKLQVITRGTSNLGEASVSPFTSLALVPPTSRQHRPRTTVICRSWNVPQHTL